jgi:hypothetical protein
MPVQRAVRRERDDADASLMRAHSLSSCVRQLINARGARFIRQVRARIKMSGRLPTVCKMYSPDREIVARTRMKRGFRDASRARGGSRGCRGVIDLHYAKITPHAVNLVCRAGMRGIPTADVDDTDTRAGIARAISSRALKIIKANLTTPLRSR